MGRRSRKRSGRGPAGPARVAAPPPAPTGSPRGRRASPPGAAGARITPERRARLAEAPPAPWAPVPLTELAILGGMVLLVVAFARGTPHGLALGVGLGLVGVASLELALREHLAGYRSHSTLIAAVAGVAVVVLLGTLTDLARPLLSAPGLVVAGVAFVALRRVFQDRAGGLGFRA